MKFNKKKKAKNWHAKNLYEPYISLGHEEVPILH